MKKQRVVFPNGDPNDTLEAVQLTADNAEAVAEWVTNRMPMYKGPIDPVELDGVIIGLFAVDIFGAPEAFPLGTWFVDMDIAITKWTPEEFAKRFGLVPEGDQ